MRDLGIEGFKESAISRFITRNDTIVKTGCSYAGCLDCDVLGGPGYAPLIRVATPLLD